MMNTIKNRLITQYPFDDVKYDKQLEIAERAFELLEELHSKENIDFKSLKLPVIK